MNITNSPFSTAFAAVTSSTPAPLAPPAPETGRADSPEFRKAFDDFVGQTFFGQMLASMRKSVGKPAYFHGGRTEEVFQAQLDQVLSEQMANASATSFTEPMFELYNLSRF